MSPFEEPLILSFHVILTALMTGVIWVIQLVHYPSFHYVNMVVYTKFQKFHMARISYIVMPLMIGELVSGLTLLAYNMSVVYILNMVCLSLIWLSTFLLSVPCHAKLEKAYNYDAVERLVLTNWPRTLLWSGRLLLLFFFLV